MIGALLLVGVEVNGIGLAPRFLKQFLYGHAGANNPPGAQMSANGGKPLDQVMRVHQTLLVRNTLAAAK
jgi:hypothetical protein